MLNIIILSWQYGSDIVAQAKAGTGKTLVFTIVILENIKSTNGCPQALVVSPTREIALQSTDVIKIVGQSIPHLKVASFVGGLKVKDDKNSINKSKIISINCCLLIIPVHTYLLYI